MDVGLGFTEDTNDRPAACLRVFSVPREAVWFGETRRITHLSGMRRGFTLPELLIVLTIAGIVMAIAVPRAKAGLDRVSVRSAASDVRATLNYARMLAMAGGIAVAVDVDSVAGTLRIRRSDERILIRGIGPAHGVRLGKTRDSLTYDPRGFGRGAANLSILLRRGASVETVFVSRLGRVR